MAGKVNSKMSVVVACLVALLQISSSAAKSYTVGETNGWTNSGVDYTSWASGKTFAVGDTLVFNFGSGSHTVTEVLKSEYDACTSTTKIFSTSTSLATILGL